MIFKIVDRKISVESEVVLSYSLDYVATFEFDEEWNNKIVTARFVHENGNMVEVVLDSENSCNIPLFPKGVVNVGVYTDEFTSTYAPMRIYTSIKDIGEYEVIPPTADVYQQIISLIEEGRIKGEDGFSPTVVIEDIEGGHTVVITDAEGDKEFDVMDGSDYTITESDYQAIADRVPQPDLSDYVKNTDYATSSKGGVVKVGSYSTDVLDGKLSSKVLTNAEYNASGTRTFVSKGTLENVLPSKVDALTKPMADKLEALWKMNEGQTYDVYESESEDYSKAIPSGAYWVSLDMVGGKSEVRDGEIISSHTDEVVVAKADETITKSIPTNFPVLRSAGNVYDYIDLNKGELHRRVGVVDLGSFNWTYNRDNNTFYTPCNLNPVCNKNPLYDANGWCYTCTRYQYPSNVNEMWKLEKTGLAFIPYGISATPRIYVRDLAYASASEFKTAMQGVMLYYELAEEIIEPITIPTDLTEWLEVEPNGSITFVNDGKLLVPNTERFVRKLNEV